MNSSSTDEQELTIANIKTVCEKHFSSSLTQGLSCDVLPGEQGPSFLAMKHIEVSSFGPTTLPSLIICDMDKLLGIFEFEDPVLWVLGFRNSAFCRGGVGGALE